jgi:ArsR family transcriptional regulator
MEYSYAEYALLFKALSDETRLKILNMVSDVELCACKILEEFNITQPTLSYHMKILIASELVIGEKKGSWMFYTLNKEKAEEIIDLLNEITSQKKTVPNNCGDENSKIKSFK